MKPLRAGCLVLLLIALGASSADAGPPSPRVSIDSEARTARDADRAARVIVRYKPGAATRLKSRLKARGNRVGVDHARARVMSLSLRPGELRRLAADPDVVGISTDARIAAHDWFDGEPADSAGEDVQNLRRTLGLAAHASGGAGVGVAVIDSGIAPVPDLLASLTAFYDFTDGGVMAPPSDAYGHGTHVAGLIAGNGLFSAGRYQGIAPGVRLIGLKVLDANGQGYASDLLNAIDFAIDNRAALGIDIINLSLGHPILEPAADDPLVQAVERASAAGIVVVASAGNFGKRVGTGGAGYGGITSPGNAPSALTVGAVDTHATTARGDDRVANYSSRGPTWFDGGLKPDVVAPGSGLVAITNPFSTLYARNNLRADTWSYARLSGTSMATAVASGVVALMIEANRTDEGASTPLAPNTVKALLQFSSIAVDRAGVAVPAEFEQGAGAINAAAAVDLARLVDPSAPVGSPWLEAGITPATVIGDETLAWSSRVLWGRHVVLGDSVAWRVAAWSDTIVWGEDVPWVGALSIDGTDLVTSSADAWSDQIVWGDGLVSATSFSSEDHIVWGNAFDDEHIVWGNSMDEDHIVWGNSIVDDPLVSLLKER